MPSEDIKYWDSVAHGAANPDSMKVTFNPGKVHSVMHHLFKYPVDKIKILEIGIGRALIPGSMRNVCVGFDYVGTDLSYDFCKWGKKVFHLRALQSRIEDLPFKTGAFTYIWLFDVLEHIDPRLRKDAYREINRVLRQKDALVFINNPCSPTKHPQFDWGFDQLDIGVMAHSLGMIIKELELYQVGDSMSQFIALMR